MIYANSQYSKAEYNAASMQIVGAIGDVRNGDAQAAGAKIEQVRATGILDLTTPASTCLTIIVSKVEQGDAIGAERNLGDLKDALEEQFG